MIIRGKMCVCVCVHVCTRLVCTLTCTRHRVCIVLPPEWGVGRGRWAWRVERGVEQEEHSPAVCPDLPTYTQPDRKAHQPRGVFTGMRWAACWIPLLTLRAVAGQLFSSPLVHTDILRKDLNSRKVRCSDSSSGSRWSKSRETFRFLLVFDFILWVSFLDQSRALLLWVKVKREKTGEKNKSKLLF